jgi:hypothetical protein
LKKFFLKLQCVQEIFSAVIVGPGQGFEPWRKAPQASMLPSYITPATFYFGFIEPRPFLAMTCYFRFRKILPQTLSSQGHTIKASFYKSAGFL